ncbi:MAG: hypothetical protein ACPIOQ_40305, partial [Promethearchaeia archaeon]
MQSKNPPQWQQQRAFLLDLLLYSAFGSFSTTAFVISTFGNYRSACRPASSTRRPASSSAPWCFAPQKDIVVPPLAPRELRPDAEPSSPTVGTAAYVAYVQRPWEHLLVHAGGVYGPGGVR